MTFLLNSRLLFTRFWVDCGAAESSSSLTVTWWVYSTETPRICLYLPLTADSCQLPNLFLQVGEGFKSRGVSSAESWNVPPVHEKWDVWTNPTLFFPHRGTKTRQSWYLSFVFTSSLITTASVKLDSSSDTSRFNNIGETFRLLCWRKRRIDIFTSAPLCKYVNLLSNRSDSCWVCYRFFFPHSEILKQDVKNNTGFERLKTTL